jgi:Rieske Fe-S protein
MKQYTRRGVLVGVAALGTIPLAACGGTSAEPPSVKGGPEQGPRTPEAGQGGHGIVAGVSDIPVGGGKIDQDRRLVLTQPAPGDFKAFSAVCTHQGCLVSTVQNGIIRCACHGSEFSAADGSVRSGPATKPLPPRDITIEAGQIRLLD